MRFHVSLDPPGLREHVERILPPGWKPCDPADTTGSFALRRADNESYDVMIGTNAGLLGGTLEIAIAMLDAEIRMFVASNAPDRTFVHAGVVAHGRGALVIPGESFSGKTTLVKALVEAGATYYSDEYAVLDADGGVHPYPRPLSIRYHEVTQEQTIGELGGIAGSERAEIAVVVVTRYRPGADWQPTPLSQGAGVLALLANTIPAQERPEPSLRAVTRAAAGATVLESERGEAGPVADALLELLAAPVPR